MRRLAPSRLLRLERRSARFRLTLFYAGVFLLLGVGVLVVVYVFAAHSSAVVALAVRRVPGTGVTTVHPVPVGDTAGLLVRTHAVDLAWLLQVSIVELVVITVGATWLGWIAAGRVLKPIEEITTTARTISAGNLHQRLALVGPDDEFKRLGDTLDELLARLETSFETQRRFVANASHELRTPLTLERTLLQLALADPEMSTETLRATCEELLATGREQELLLEALLTLASSERGLERRDPIELRGLAQSALAKPRPNVERLALEVEAQLGLAETLGDQALIERLIANLIDNAVEHNESGGRVEVTTSTNQGRAILEVANSGPQIDPQDLERLTEPFVRGSADRTSANGHHGLGLSIVRAIADAHGAELTLQARSVGGLRVIVSFPSVTTLSGSQ